MLIISDYLDNSHDHYKTTQYNQNIEDAEDNIRKIEADKATAMCKIDDDFETFLNKLSSINYTDPKWFTTSPPTLKVNPKPSAIFVDYNETDYVTYEKIENINDRTPTVIGGNVGENPSTNFRTTNYIKRSIYVLRT
jgi:hypothetical protein